MIKKCISKGWKFSSPDFKESKTVDLPHDYSVLLPRDKNCPGGASNGFFTGTCGSYVKYIDGIDSEHIILDVDGAYMCARVMLNEHQLVMHPHGYTPFLTDLTPKLRKNKTNKIEITTQNIQPSTRWYSGAGLYRDVFMWTGGSVRIEPWDMFISTKSVDKKAEISVLVDISADFDTEILLKNTISYHDKALTFTEKLNVTEGKNKCEFTYVIDNPHLWNVDTPCLYELKSEIIIDERIEDVHTQSFGIRTVYADAEKGLLINGKPVNLKGGCVHHDHGALGAASFPAAEYRRLKKLKDAGYNAVRTAHNPPSLAFLEICDTIGLYVMDEAFDMWNVPKNRLDYSLWFSDWWARDIKSMVLRDRNHPCIISYSIGNEITERDCTSDGAQWAKALSDEVRKYDSTKLVTSGICGFWETPDENAPKDYNDNLEIGLAQEGDVAENWASQTEKYIEPLDIIGYNYLYLRYEHDHKLYPKRVIWSSETHALNFYHSWQSVLNNSYVIGDFTWTAYDNMGEAGTGRSAWERDETITGISLARYPWRNCYQGDFDLCGYRRPQSYFRESIWKENCEPKMFTTHPEHYGENFTGTGWHWYDVSESWTFEDEYIGKPVKVEVYTDADEISFELNGKKVGTAKPQYGIACIDVPYAKGTLISKAYKSGTQVGISEIHTVGRAGRIAVVPETSSIVCDNRDLCYFDIFVTDENGDIVPDAQNEIYCSCDGGELMCVFSGNPANEDDFTSNSCHTYYGKAVAVVRAKNPGDVTLTVISNGLKAGASVVVAIFGGKND